MPMAISSISRDAYRLLAALLASALLHAGLAIMPLQTSAPSAETLATSGGPLPLDIHLSPTAVAPRSAQPTRPAPKAAAKAPPEGPPATTAPDVNTDSAEFVHSGRLTRQPYPLDPVNLDIPEARLPTVDGSFVIRLWINAQGQVVAFEAEPTHLPVEYVVAVGETLSAIRFAPGQISGKPVPSIYRMEISTTTDDDRN
jgi:hypothetical protein